MSKILKNTTGSDIIIADVGNVTIPASSQKTLDPINYWFWARSSDVVVHVGSGDLVVNDGTSDLSANDGMKLLQGIFPNPVGIASGVDGTEIGHKDDALKIVGGDDGVADDPEPAKNVVYKDVKLKNGSNDSMDINGSSTPQNFDFAPGAGEVWYVEKMCIFLDDPGSMDRNDFGSINGGGLNNGVQILIRTKGTEYEHANLQDNMDINFSFSKTVGTYGEYNGGFWNEEDVYTGECYFTNPIKLDGDQSDYVRFRIRDNITGLDEMKVSLRLWRVI